MTDKKSSLTSLAPASLTSGNPGNSSSVRLIAALVAVCVIAGNLALLVVVIPLDELPLFRDYVWISIKLTTSGEVSRNARYSDSAMAYYSFGWLMAPLFFLLCWKWGKASDGKYDTLLFIPVVQLTIWKRMALVLLTPLWLGLTVGGWIAFDGSDSRILMVGSSLPVLVCFGWVAPASLAAAAFLFVASLKKAFFGTI